MYSSRDDSQDLSSRENNLASLAGSLNSAVDELSKAWFPRIIDNERGGFNCDFDFKWQQKTPNDKMLEFQARTLRFVSRAAILKPGLRQWAEHGYRFLADVMWDKDYGGWYRLVDAVGTPLEEQTKHGHGMAYAISACVRYHQLTGSGEALELAQQAFSWLDRYAHDADGGGYFSYYQRDGSRILTAEAAPDAHKILDPLGNPVGFKECNTTTDLLEALGELYELWPDPKLRDRLVELLNIVMQHVTVSPGVVNLAFTRDWTPIPNLTLYAQCLQTASIIVLASSALNDGEGDTQCVQRAKEIVDHMLRIAWDDTNGGFHHAGASFGATAIESCPYFVPDKVWWCQAEALRALLVVDKAFPHEQYDAWAMREWQYIDKFLIDHRHGGWQFRGSDSVRFDKHAPKSSLWKDPCHEGVALLVGIELCDQQSP